MNSPLGAATARPAGPGAENDFAALRQLVTERGVFGRQDRYYAAMVISALGMLALGIALALVMDGAALVLPFAVLLGFVNVRLELLGHDVGHMQVIRNPRRVHHMGLFLGDLLLGISYTHWIARHNKHHAFPNHVEKDPDGNYPVLALHPQQLASRSRLLRPLIAIQAFLFLLWLPLQPIGMRVAGFRHIRHGHVRHPVAETVALAAHFALYGWFLSHLGGWPLALAFAAIHQGVMGVYNGLVFAPNHKGMPMVDEGSRLGFLREQVVTARNIRGNPVTDYLFGGLNFQIEHHLFPTIPSNKLKRIQPLVERFCKDHAIAYHKTSVAGSYRDLFTHLHHVSAPLRRRSGRPVADPAGA